MGQAAVPLAIGGMVLGTATSFYGGMQSAQAYANMAGMYNQIGQMQNQLYQYNAAVSAAEAEKLRRIGDYNQTAAEIDALAIIEQTSQEAADLWTYGNKLMGTQRVMYASAGIELSGSPLEVMNETQSLIERDATRIIEKGEKAADRARLIGLSDAMMADLEATRAESQSNIQSMLGQVSLYQAAMQARSAMAQSNISTIGAWGSLLNGVSRIGMMTAGGGGGDQSSIWDNWNLF